MICFRISAVSTNVAIIPNTSLHNPVVIPLKFLHHLLSKIYRALSGIPVGIMMNTRVSHGGSQIVTHVFNRRHDVHVLLVPQGFDRIWRALSRNM